ncbi:hypothetical protein BG005_002704, partial [Podila minutissima]
MEQRIRNRSARITSLPQWKSDVSSLAPVETVSLSKAKPTHPILLELFHQPTLMTPSLQIEKALKVYQDHPNELTSKDFVFVLETIQDHASSQEQFWESVISLIRSSPASHRESVKIVTNKASFPPVDWNRAIASALSRVYWNQKQEVFLAQVLHAKETDEALEEQFQKQLSRPEARGQGGDERPRRLFAPFMSTHQIMALTMVESLLHKFNAGYALDLYARLTELGIHMPARVMSALVRVAVQSGDGYQLEKIGNLLVSEHQRPSMDRPPQILTAKLMDTFVHGVCEHELYELARDVFNKGVEAGGKYRAQTFTRILNSLSVKDFGFDIVNAATVAEKGKRKGGKQGQERPSASTDLSVTSKNRKAIAVADPKVVERYIQVMEQQSVQPTVTTLNVLVKLYLEMAQYRVVGAPSWRTAFRRYNPQGLVPDVVTNNILLAYYERHKDLNTMLKIYNDMAGELEDGVAAGGLLRKNKKKKLDAVAPAPQDNQKEPVQSKPEKEVSDETQDQEPQRLTPLQLEQMAEQEELKRLEEQAEREQQARQRQKRGRSQRDIYTYNTMLHALLQHAVESKDIAAIGQCFHDMEQDGISADTVTFNTNILYHIASGDLASAVQVFRSMQETDVARGSGEESNPDETNLPSKPAKSRPSYAGTSRSVTTSPSPTSTPTTPAPDVVSLTSMISGFGQASQMDQATVFFREMTDTFKIEPNLKTYSTLVAGLHRAGDHERAERLWDIVLKEDDLAQQEALERASLDLGGKVVVSEESEGRG